MILLNTTLGDITIKLNYERAPITAENFENHVKSGYYDGVIFHRVIDGFMIQTGGFEADMKEKSKKDPIENEADNGLKNTRGSLAMARTMDPHSASTQFFINVSDNDFLNHSAKTSHGWGYAVFGEVISGMDIVDAIKKVKTTFRGGHDDVPKEEIIITKASIIDDIHDDTDTQAQPAEQA